jgi:mono/diheme cytochrome c family protein
MSVRKFGLIVAVVLASAVFAMAQAPKTETVVKHVPIRATNPASGQEMFSTYCAVCHGKDGKGNGPAAPALKTPPADLTALAKKDGGKYPALHVSSVIRGEADLPAHGNKEMPVWGTLFLRLSQGHEAEVQQRVTNLNHYIETLQPK